jgi:hypothetical protein
MVVTDGGSQERNGGADGEGGGSGTRCTCRHFVTPKRLYATQRITSRDLMPTGQV